MDYRPCHIITNDRQLQRVLRFYHVEVITASEDYTQEEGLHYHYLVHWPIRERRGRPELKPTKATLARGARRLITPRCVCYNKQHNAKCDKCGVWYKYIWPKDNEHTQNIYRYIRRKIELHAEWELRGPESKERPKN